MFMSDKDYILTVGLEIHAELKTKTKMFCNSKNDADEIRPNVNICPVCMGHPGTLPVINREAVKHVLRVGAAVGGAPADFTEFDRKNYFYPDIPKGYQLSQYKYPLVSGGTLAGVKLTRVHLEEDTATSSHHDKGTNDDNNDNNEDGKSHRHGNELSYSLVDFNRAGVPLMELVTEPVIHDAKTAGNFAKELQLLLRYLGVSDANMEKGEMRVEANISVSKATEMLASAEERRLNAETRGNSEVSILRPSASSQRNSSVPLGTKVEVKNLNSFRAVERAIEYEAARQRDVLEAGERVVQETRGWDEKKQATYSQRTKEDAHDYRYFPDPDLPKLKLFEIPEFSAILIKKSLPELPWEKRERYLKEGIRREYADMFVADRKFGNLFEATLAEISKKYKNIPCQKTLVASYIGSDIAGLVSKFGDSGLSNMSGEGLAAVMMRVTLNEISSRGAKDAIAEVFVRGGDLAEVSKKYLQQSNADELKKTVQTIIDANGKVVMDYKNGKEAALQFLVGQGMKATKGSANPDMLKSIIRSIIG